MRKFGSGRLAKMLVVGVAATATFGASAAIATDATAAPAPSSTSTPQLDLTGIENQLQFILNEVLNITSNNLVQCILSGFTAPNCGHNPV